MKKLITLCALIITITLSAQDTDATFKQQTVEFIQLTGTGDIFNNAISQIGMMVPDVKKEAYTKEATATLDELYNKMADLYMKEFTKKEILELLAFYKTDLGKKLASKQTELTQQGMALGQSWGLEVSAIAQKYSH